MDRTPSHNHDCARCEHRAAFGLDFNDDLELGVLAAITMPTSARHLLSRSPQAAATRDTANNIPVELNILALENINHHIVESYFELGAKVCEQQDLVLESNDRRGARGHLFMDEEFEIVRKLHELRLRRGCTCCNPLLHSFDTAVINAILSHGRDPSEE